MNSEQQLTLVERRLRIPQQFTETEDLTYAYLLQNLNPDMLKQVLEIRKYCKNLEIRTFLEALPNYTLEKLLRLPTTGTKEELRKVILNAPSDKSDAPQLLSEFPELPLNPHYMELTTDLLEAENVRGLRNLITLSGTRYMLPALLSGVNPHVAVEVLQQTDDILVGDYDTLKNLPACFVHEAELPDGSTYLANFLHRENLTTEEQIDLLELIGSDSSTVETLGHLVNLV